MSDSTPALDDLDVLDSGGVSVRLGTLWIDRPVLLALVRHFG
ncbi:MAG TPA: hypothetical protein QF624_04175 [Dehalococcoidia bacterium]|nr:hypothetical protein [Dehalococcoidia bacterium]